MCAILGSKTWQNLLPVAEGVPARTAVVLEEVQSIFPPIQGENVFQWLGLAARYGLVKMRDLRIVCGDLARLV